MPLLDYIRSLFTRTPPSTFVLNGIGEFTESRPGFWHGRTTLDPGGEDMGILFKTAGEPPGQAEAEMWQRIARRWPELWSHVLESLQRDLQFDSSDEKTEFFAALRPNGCLFEVLSTGQEKWEISVEPEYSDHVLLVSMLGMSYDGYDMDG